MRKCKKEAGDAGEGMKANYTQRTERSFQSR